MAQASSKLDLSNLLEPEFSQKSPLPVKSFQSPREFPFKPLLPFCSSFSLNSTEFLRKEDSSKTLTTSPQGARREITEMRRRTLLALAVQT